MERWKSLVQMADSYLAQERFTEAELLLSEAVDEARSVDLDDKDFIVLLQNLTRAVRPLDPARARTLDDELLKAVREGDTCTQVDEEEVMLFIIGSRREFEPHMAPPERQKLLKMAISVVHMVRDAHGDISVETARAIYEVASLLLSIGKIDLAVRALRQSLRQAVLADARHPLRLQIQVRLAEALLLDGGMEEARTLLLDALERRDVTRRERPQLVDKKGRVTNLYLLAKTAAIQGDVDEARDLAQKAMTLEKARAPQSGLLKEIQDFMGEDVTSLDVQ